MTTPFCLLSMLLVAVDSREQQAAIPLGSWAVRVLLAKCGVVSRRPPR